jgi:prophage regulatory protein
MNAVLRLPSVKAKIGLARSTIYYLIARNKFPRPVALGARAIGWHEHEIDEWIASRPAPSSVPVAKRRPTETAR